MKDFMPNDFCIFCGEKKLEVVEINKQRVFFAHCENCQADGPTMLDRQGAIDSFVNPSRRSTELHNQIRDLRFLVVSNAYTAGLS